MIIKTIEKSNWFLRILIIGFASYITYSFITVEKFTWYGYLIIIIILYIILAYKEKYIKIKEDKMVVGNYISFLEDKKYYDWDKIEKIEEEVVNYGKSTEIILRIFSNENNFTGTEINGISCLNIPEMQYYIKKYDIETEFIDNRPKILKRVSNVTERIDRTIDF